MLHRLEIRIFNFSLFGILTAMRIRLGDLRSLIREKLAIDTVVRAVASKGKGLFANDFIPQGGLIFRWKEGFDHTYDPDFVESFPPVEQAEMKSLASYDGVHWFLAGDDGAFFNHSSAPNVSIVPGVGSPSTWDRIALQDIMPGEELTMNYEEIGLDF
jgi:hypothetical protein